MSLKIRHVLDTKGIFAVYFLDPPLEIDGQMQYAKIVECIYMALVNRPVDDDASSETIDEIIGFVIDSTVVPADETSDGVAFMWYVNRNDFSEDNWKTYMQSLPAWSKKRYDLLHPPVIEVPEVVLTAPTQSKSHRRRR